MNAKQFKNIIKEAVREAVREELRSVLSETQQPLQETKTFNFTSNDVMKGGLPDDARNSLRSKMGMEFGFQQPYNNLQVQPNAENPFLLNNRGSFFRSVERMRACESGKPTCF